jgi:hypothetical protein
MQFSPHFLAGSNRFSGGQLGLAAVARGSLLRLLSLLGKGRDHNQVSL